MRSTTFLDCAGSSPAARRKLSRCRLAAALLLALAPLAAGAATIVVTSPDDTDSSEIGTCTLRQAIMSMDVGGLLADCHKTGAAFGVDDTITFAESAITGATTPGTVTLADSADAGGGIGGTLLVTAAHLTIDGSAWRGNGAGQYADGVTIARPAGASNKFGILRDTAPAGGALVLHGIAIRNGYALDPLCDGFGEGGGICMVAANLAMTDSRVSGNRAGNGGGGIASVTGTLTLTRCTIDQNVAYLGGGVHVGSGGATITASTIEGNGEWAVSHGGGIQADGTLLVADSTISGNTGKRGSGVRVAGTLSLVRSVVDGNEAYYNGGGIHVLAGGTAAVDSSTISGNFARYNGGGMMYSQGKGRVPLAGRSGGDFVHDIVKARFPDFKPKRILEIGCGTGRNTTSYKRLYPDAEVVAVDCAAPLLRYAFATAEHEGVGVHFKQMDITSLSFPDESFDLVVSHIVGHETTTRGLPLMLSEAYRVLTPGGVMFHLDVPTQPGHLKLFDQVLNDWQVRYNGEPFWMGWADANVKGILQNIGVPDDTAFAEYMRPPEGGAAWFCHGGRKPLTSKNRRAA